MAHRQTAHLRAVTFLVCVSYTLSSAYNLITVLFKNGVFVCVRVVAGCVHMSAIAHGGQTCWIACN